MEKIYLSSLSELTDIMESVEETPYSNYAKIISLTTMNMRYENIAFNTKLNEHPYILTDRIVKDTISMFRSLMDIAFIESKNKQIKDYKSGILKEKHQELWQEIWSRHNKNEFQEFIDHKRRRFEVNGLQKYIAGKSCVEFGCGNGAILFALLEMGAISADGIDFGEESVKYCRHVAAYKNIRGIASFYVGDVTNTPFKNNQFDFAVSNGVFHHLKQEDIPIALKEVARVLKPSGWFWYYVDGKGAISMDLWDASVNILKKVDILIIESILKSLNISRNKMVHLMDDFSATYLHSTWDEVTEMLTGCGFGNFKRMTGGTSKDFDHDRINVDPYGEAKFGCGDLRLICQKIG